MMQEYWINVYDSIAYGRQYGINQLSRSDAIKTAFNRMCCSTEKVIYRIHVKMDGGYNKDRLAYQEMLDKMRTRRSKMDWMG